MMQPANNEAETRVVLDGHMVEGKDYERLTLQEAAELEGLNRHDRRAWFKQRRLARKVQA